MQAVELATACSSSWNDSVCQEVADKGVPHELVPTVAALLADARRRTKCSRGDCLWPGNGGVLTFVMSRVRELDPHKPRRHDSRDNHLTVELHFYPWDAETYGPWSDKSGAIQRMKRRLRESRSPVEKIALLPAEPIDRVAHRVDARNAR